MSRRGGGGRGRGKGKWESYRDDDDSQSGSNSRDGGDEPTAGWYCYLTFSFELFRNDRI